MRIKQQHLWISLFSLLIIGIYTIPAFSQFHRRGQKSGNELPPGAIAKLGDSKLNHGGPKMVGMGFTPDGKRIITAAQDRYVRFWNPVTGDEDISRRITATEGSKFIALAVPFQGEHLVTLEPGEQNTIKSFSMENGRSVAQYGYGNDYGVSISADGKYAASFGKSNIRVWETISGSELRDFNALREAPKAVAFFPGSSTRLVMLGESGKKIYVFEWITGKNIGTVELKDFVGQCIGFTNGGRWLYVGGEKGLFAIDSSGKNRDGASGPMVARGLVSGLHKGTVTGIGGSSNDGMAAIAYEDSKIAVFDSNVRKFQTTIIDGGIIENFLAFQPGGKLLATAGAGGMARLYRTNQEYKLVFKPRGHGGMITDAFFNKDATVLMTGSVDGTVRFWDAKNANFLRTIRVGAPVDSVRYNRDYTKIVVATKNGVQCFDLEGKELWTYELEHQSRVMASFNDKGGVHVISKRGFAILDEDGKETKRYFHGKIKENGKWLDDIRSAMITTDDFMISPSGHMAFVISEDKTTLTGFDLNTEGHQLFEHKGPAREFRALRFSDNGQFFVEALDEKWTLYDHKGRPRTGWTRNKEESPYEHIGVNNDGSMVMAGVTGGHNIWAWDLRAGQAGDEYTGHNGAINLIRYSPDGSKWASISLDGVVFIRK